MHRLTLNGLVKSVLLSILLITISTKIQAQDTNTTPTPDFAPKSPEAAAFLKYGEYPVDLSTGVPGISIPLYTVDIKDFKLPISLDYHASGIKVTQEATWVGLGWNLNAGAQVILSPRDEIDENNPYIDDIPDDDSIIAFFKLHPYKHNDVLALNSNLDQSRVKDMYVFSSPTANGSFYIRNFANNDVVTIPPNAFKVDLQGTSRENMTFKITDPQGNLYLLNTTEVSVRTMTHDDRYISAWYVDEIKTPSNNKISFTYQDDGGFNDISIFQSVKISKRSVSKTAAGVCIPIPLITTQIGAVTSQTSNTQTLSKKIKEITFNDGNSRILFTKTDGRQDLINGNGFLNKIEIQQRAFDGFQSVKGFVLQYSYFVEEGGSINYTGKRLKLNKIVDLNGQDQQSFVYSDITVPNKTSKAQDYFGYNNGWGGQDLIPKHYLSYPYVTEVGNGNRNVNSSVNQAGILKEIHYPTKGWTKFNYETNQFFGVDNFSKYVPVTVNGYVVQGTGGTVPVKEGPGIDGTICLNTNPLDCVNYVSIPFTAINAGGLLTFKLDKPVGDDPTLFKYHYAKVRIISGGNEVYNSGSLVGQEYNVPVTLPESGTIEVEVYGQYYSVRNLQLKYVNNDVIPKNVLGAGLRIQSVENYNFDNNLLLKKEYDYSDISNQNISSGKLINELITSYTSHQFTNYNFSNCGTGENYETAGCFPASDVNESFDISSNSRYGIEGNSVIYRYVKEKQIDPANLTNNGFTQYEFTVEGDNIPLGNPAVQISTTWKRGKVLNKKIYKTIGTSNYIVEEEKNTYIEDAAKISYYNGFKMFRRAKTNIVEYPANPLTLLCPYNADGLDIRVLDIIEPITYNIQILWYYQKTSEKSSYFYNASNSLTGTVVNTTTFNYNNPAHLQLTSQTTTSSVGETLETKYFYAQDSDMISKPFVTELKAAYMVGIPLDTQTFKAGAKIAEQLTNYDKSTATNNLLLPKAVYANKGSAAIDLTLDKKLTYDLYDDKGNVLQYTPDSGIPVSIIWGYNKSQPIAKVENVAYATIPVATITNLQALSDADSDNCLTGSCSEQLLRNGLNTFRTSLPNAFISTYTYNQLVGVTSVTDVKGISTYYEYDTYNRLRFVKDKDLNVLQKYCYNYKGEAINCGDNTSTSVVLYNSIAKSGSFTKNNCASGGVGSSVLYNQAVGAATSTVSQADADALGLAKFNTDGQANANANGTCTFTSIVKSGSFAKNNCAAGGVGSAVVYTVPAGRYTSTTSQAAADALAQTDVTNNGQANANTNGTCTFSSIVKTGSFTKNNCTAGGVGSTVVYTVPAGRYTSTTSQAAADALAQTDVTNNGQANANTNGTCTFSSIVKTGSFTKNNCAAGGAGSAVVYTVPAGRYTSTTSQAAADALAQTDVTNNGQTNANTNGTCTFTSIVKTGSFTKNNCAAGGVGSAVVYTVPAGRYTSTTSQAAADALAQTDVTNNGQANANTNGTCTFTSIVKSGSFTKNNCATGGVGSAVVYTVPAGRYTSTTSKAAADALAQTDVDTNGQANANTNGTCTFTNIVKSGSFTKNNCAAGGVGSAVVYTVPAGRYTSTTSQAAADALAQTDVTNNGQANANTNGTCTFTSIVKSGSFTKNNCAAGGVGSAVVYTVPAGRYTSTTSQAAADALAQTDVTNNGQANANTNGTCTFTSISKSGSFTKNNCAAGGVGSAVVYTVPAGRYTSTTSQAAADAIAQTDVDNNGQTNANTNGTCTFTSIVKSGSFTKNNCIVGGVGSAVVYTVPAGRYTSTASQAAADALAQTDVTNNGQSNANTNGVCTFSSAAKNVSFTKNDCPANTTPGTFIYSVPAGKYTSTSSQTAADQLAQNEVNAYGQNWANEQATCTFYSASKSGTFTRNNCAAGYTGGTITYTLPYGAYLSTVSQADADNKAQTDVNNNGQSYANTNGGCIEVVSFTYDYEFSVSAKLLYLNVYASSVNHNGATLNFNINYLRTSGAAATQTATVVVPAGQDGAYITVSLTAKSITSVDLLQLIKN